MRARHSIVLAVPILITTLGMASAAPIDLDNDVSISWSDDFADPIFFTVVGAPRLVPNANQAGNLLNLDIDIDLGDITRPEELGGGTNNVVHSIILRLLVGDSSLEEVIVDGKPLVLSYEYNTQFNALGEKNLVNWFALHPEGIIPLTLFTNVAKLPAGDLVFALEGEFFGADSGNPTGRITMSGPGTALSVPEPTTFSLLLLSALGSLATIFVQRVNFTSTGSGLRGERRSCRTRESNPGFRRRRIF